MAPRLKPQLLKKLIIVGGVLAALQIGVIFFLSDGSTPPSQKDAIDQAVSKLNDLTPDRKQMVRVQLALADYMAKNKGTPPASLAELVPTYFESLPTDATTGKPFKYKVEGTRYVLGESTAMSGAPVGTNPKGATGSKGSAAATAGSDAEKDALLAVLSDDSSKDSPAYDPTGKRDPFKAFDLSPKQDGNLARTPLEGIPIDKFKYSAYLQSESDPKAIIELEEGRGFTVSKGTKIGPNGGEVTDIIPEKIIIVETEVDFTGEKRSRTVELYIGMRNSSGNRSKK